MRLIFLTFITMVAFAANSVLNKIGITDGGMDPLGFATVRLWSGATVLAVLVALRGAPKEEVGSVIGTVSLLVYMLGFSVAYVTLDAGVGALILFGVVQITMFGVAVWAGEAVPAGRYAGCAVAFGGLVALLWPSGSVAPDLGGAVLMSVAGVGWASYTLVGRSAKFPLARTSRNFIYAALIMLAATVVVGVPAANFTGVLCSIFAGAVTSALGYTLWYKILPQLPTSIAATVQLSVPVIALAGGMVFLGEELTVRFAVACVLVLSGIALALRKAA